MYDAPRGKGQGWGVLLQARPAAVPGHPRLLRSRTCAVLCVGCRRHRTGGVSHLFALNPVAQPRCRLAPDVRLPRACAGARSAPAPAPAAKPLADLLFTLSASKAVFASPSQLVLEGLQATATGFNTETRATATYTIGAPAVRVARLAHCLCELAPERVCCCLAPPLWAAAGPVAVQALTATCPPACRLVRQRDDRRAVRGGVGSGARRARVRHAQRQQRDRARAAEPAGVRRRVWAPDLCRAHAPRGRRAARDRRRRHRTGAPVASLPLYHAASAFGGLPATSHWPAWRATWSLSVAPWKSLEVSVAPRARFFFP